MDNIIKFTVLGKPHGKDRPRFCRRGKFVTTYNTKATIEYENLIKKSALEQCNEQLDRNYSGEVKIHIIAYFKPNKSMSKKQKDLLLGKPYLKKPDIDNLCKVVEDALNGVAYKDDSQIALLYAEKYYSDEEKLEVRIIYDTE